MKHKHEVDASRDPERTKQRLQNVNKALKQLSPGFHQEKIEELQAEKKQLLRALRGSEAAEVRREAPTTNTLSRRARRRLRQELREVEEELKHLESKVRNYETQRKMKALRQRRAAIVSRLKLAAMFGPRPETRQKQEETQLNNAETRKKQKRRLKERERVEEELAAVNEKLKAMRAKTQNEKVARSIEALRQRKMYLEYKLHEGVMQTPQYDMWMYWYKGPGKVRFLTGRQD